MKRALLIAGGTVGGLGAVLAITPPQLGTTSAINIAGGPVTGPGATTSSASASSSSSAASASASASATTKATAAATKNAKPVVTKSSGTNTAATAPATQAPATTAPTITSTKSINGTFTGPSINVNYGNVQVKITVVNGRITDAVAVKAPSGKNDRWTNMAVPILKAQTLAAQSANIQGASGASYTSYGWHTSLQGALAQAGL
jgi:uncharacterized protein with FMN-binding domain